MLRGFRHVIFVRLTPEEVDYVKSGARKRTEIDNASGVKDALIGREALTSEQYKAREDMGVKGEYAVIEKLLRGKWVPYMDRPDNGVDFMIGDKTGQIKTRRYGGSTGLGPKLWPRASIIIVCQPTKDDPNSIVVVGWFTDKDFFDRHIHADNEYRLGDRFLSAPCEYCGHRAAGQPWLEDKHLRPISELLEKHYAALWNELRAKADGFNRIIL